MKRKRSSQQLIQESLHELTRTIPIEKITTNMIVENCGLTKRTFYNYYRDKYDVLNSYHFEWAEGHLNEPIETWVRSKNELFTQFADSQGNILLYEGQNNLFEAQSQVEIQKFMMHVRPDVDRSAPLMDDIIDALYFMSYGQLGMLKRSLRSRRSQALLAESALMEDPWERLLRWMPSIVRDNIQSEPIYCDLHWDAETMTMQHGALRERAAQGYSV